MSNQENGKENGSGQKESPVKTLAELCADGYDFRASERVRVCTEELKDPGSLLKALTVSDVTICRVVKQRIEDLEEAELKLEIATKENTTLKRKVSELEGQVEVMRMMKKNKKGEKITPEQRQMINDVAAEVRKTFVRQVKFPRKEGWQYWSEDPTSASGMIAGNINWPAGCTEESKEAIWNTLIAKAVPRMVTTQRNKITQEIRNLFWGMYCAMTVWLHCSYAHVVLCTSVDYGGTQVVSKDTLKTVVNRCTPRETMREMSSTREEMMQFLVRYAICALPKEETKKALNAYASKRWDATRKMQDTIENRDAEHNHACILDLLTASDLAYIIWQYVNSYTDWCAKLALLKEGKNVNMNKSEAEWTSDHKKAPMETRADTDEGVRFYNSCLDWARGLKRLPSDDFRKLRMALNKMSVESGLIKDPSVKKKGVDTAVVAQPRSGGGGGCVDAGGFQLEDVDVLPNITNVVGV